MIINGGMLGGILKYVIAAGVTTNASNVIGAVANAQIAIIFERLYLFVFC